MPTPIPTLVFEDTGITMQPPETVCRRMDLYPESPKLQDGQLVLSARLECDRAETQRIWFTLPEEMLPMTTTNLDPFVVASVFQVMHSRCSLHVHGDVSPSLLRNLQEFQRSWHCWLPDKYAPAAITADCEKEAQVDRTERLAVVAFSGGVDSSYTVWRHTRGDAGRCKRKIEAGLLVHGFDIPLEQEEQFCRAAKTAKNTLESVGVKLLTMSSNLFHPDWEMTHGAAIAACLMMLQGRFAEGLIASTYDYGALVFPWGSNPITDPLLSSNSFGIVHDSCDTIRDDKQLVISEWKEGFNNLRVCHSARDRDKNCCRCAKCVMTYIALYAKNLPRPASFERDMTAEDLLNLTELNEAYAIWFAFMVKNSHAGNLSSAPWFGALDRCARYNQRRRILEQQLENPWHEGWRKARLRWHSIKGP